MSRLKSVRLLLIASCVALSAIAQDTGKGPPPPVRETGTQTPGAPNAEAASTAAPTRSVVVLPERDPFEVSTFCQSMKKVVKAASSGFETVRGKVATSPDPLAEAWEGTLPVHGFYRCSATSGGNLGDSYDCVKPLECEPAANHYRRVSAALEQCLPWDWQPTRSTHGTQSLFASKSGTRITLALMRNYGGGSRSYNNCAVSLLAEAL